MHVFGNPGVTQQVPERTYHVKNYKLTLHFNAAKGEVFGDEVVTLQPLAKGFQRFYLDSSELKIDSVTLETGGSHSLPLSFDARDPYLWINLNSIYGPADDLQLHIVYHGFPRTGLYFINPDSDYPNQPREIWSQGESEFNHFWFPCWDYPNDMSTSETITTVPDGESVVSNGRLVNVTRAKGLVTYDWVESIPHSTYLTSLAIGPWRKVSDSYAGKPVDYYVPEQVDEATARRSFHLTPDMLDFFSRASGVDYPYEQYAQVTVGNYFFGGMENVSATTLTDTTLHDARADPDYPSTDLVSHELGQHWFGDLVQGRGWGDIWLNEGFATYLQALYVQYHEGNDAFRFEIMQDQLEEQRQDREDYRRPIVDYHYADSMDMFDSITHEKGAVVLDMLRNVLDGTRASSAAGSQQELFFKALKTYLTTNRAQAVNTSALVKALQTTTGENLDWFFHEWVFMAGHPDYKVEARYDADKKLETVHVSQTQQVDAVTPLFDMPIELAFHGANGESVRIQVRDNQQAQAFDVPLAFQPQWVDFDPDNIIDKALEFEQPLEALLAKARKDPAMMSRLSATEQLAQFTGPESDAAVATLIQVLTEDPFYGVRCTAAASLATLGTPSAKQALLAALSQADSRVRVAAMQALERWRGDKDVYGALVDALHQDASYAARATAAENIGQSGKPGVFEVLQSAMAANPDIHVQKAILGGLAASGDSRAVSLLLASAQPGMPLQLRQSALAGLARMRDVVERDHAQDFASLVGRTLHDQYLPLQFSAEGLVATFHLIQYRKDLQFEAEHAPTPWQRGPAHDALQKLQSP